MSPHNILEICINLCHKMIFLPSSTSCVMLVLLHHRICHTMDTPKLFKFLNTNKKRINVSMKVIQFKSLRPLCISY